MEYEIIIIGSGPAGYVSAIRAAQLGKKVAIVEKGSIGGMCLNWGCIPSKSLIESAKLYRKVKKDAETFGLSGVDFKNIDFNYKKAQQRAMSIVRRLSKGVEFLLNKNKVDIYKGEARIVDKQSVSVANQLLKSHFIVIATGSYLNKVSNSQKEVNIKEFFDLQELPQNILVYGYDAPSVELAQMLAMIDRKVVLMTGTSSIMPLADDFQQDYALKMLQKYGIEVVSVQNEVVKFENDYVELGANRYNFDLLVNLSTRKAIIPENEVGIAVENGYIAVDEEFRTNIANVFAVGDVNGKSRFAHIASAQGLYVINKICGIDASFDFKKLPLNMYTYPEFAQIGYTERELQQAGIDYKISKFSLNANGKALAEGSNEGIIRVISENKYGEVLGVQIIAENATDLIGEAAAYMEMEATVYELARIIHAHPTISEVFMEAGLDALEGAIHA